MYFATQSSNVFYISWIEDHFEETTRLCNNIKKFHKISLSCPLSARYSFLIHDSLECAHFPLFPISYLICSSEI